MSSWTENPRLGILEGGCWLLHDVNAGQEPTFLSVSAKKARFWQVSGRRGAASGGIPNNPIEAAPVIARRRHAHA